MEKLQDICAAYLEGYFYAKITERLITSKILSSDLDKLKKTAVECMKDYIEHSDLNKGYVIVTNCMNKQEIIKSDRVNSLYNSQLFNSQSHA